MKLKTTVLHGFNIGAFALAIVWCCLCASGQGKAGLPSYNQQRLMYADSLFRSDNYPGAVQELTNLLNNTENKQIRAQAYYKLALMELYPKFPNKEANLAAAKNYLEKYKAEFPDNPEIRTVITWIFLITRFAEYEKAYNDMKAQVGKSENIKKDISSNYQALQESFQRCDANRDSLAHRIKILDAIIEKISKIEP